MTRPSFSPAVLLILAAGCTPPEPAVTPAPPNVAPPVPSSSAEPAAAPRDPSSVSVVPVRVPAGVVADGDLREWGAFPPPPASLRAPPPDEDPIDYPAPPAKAPPPPSNPADAASRVAVAIGGEQAWIAADLGEAAKEGVWVGIGAQVPDLPLQGEYFGRMGFVVLDCKTMPTVLTSKDGEQGYRTDPRPPELADACRRLKARHAEAKVKHAARFERLFKIDQGGVRSVGPDGALATLEGAKSVWKAGPKGATVEVSLPLSAMPRLGEAPLAKVRLAVRLGPAAPVIAREQWIWANLPDPVGFEPHADLRAHAFRRALDVGTMPPGTTTYQQPRTASYQPGDPLHIEVMDSKTCDAPSARDIPLFERLATFGDAEVGRAAAPRGTRCWIEMEPWVAILRRGKPAEIFESKGTAKSALVRDGELHVLSFEDKSYAAVPGIWSAFALTSAGARREVIVEPVPGTKEADFVSYWKDAADFTGKDGETFGWRGAKNGKGMEATWQWDAAAKVYKGTQRAVPPPSKKKK